MNYFGPNNDGFNSGTVLISSCLKSRTLLHHNMPFINCLHTIKTCSQRPHC